MKLGDVVTYKTSGYQSQYGGKINGKIKTGIIEEVLDSLDKSFKCLWIKGEAELITEFQLCGR